MALPNEPIVSTSLSPRLLPPFEEAPLRDAVSLCFLVGASSFTEGALWSVERLASDEAAAERALEGALPPLWAGCWEAMGGQLEAKRGKEGCTAALSGFGRLRVRGGERRCRQGCSGVRRDQTDDSRVPQVS